MAGPLATYERVANKVGEPIEDDESIRLANEMLEEASNWVRFYAGHPEWSAADAPDMAVTITIAAASRGYLNPAGYDKERSDAANFERGESSTWSIAARPDVAEIAVLQTYDVAARRGRMTSIPITDPDRFIPRSARRRTVDFVHGYQEPFTYVPGS